MIQPLLLSTHPEEVLLQQNEGANTSIRKSSVWHALMNLSIK